MALVGSVSPAGVVEDFEGTLEECIENLQNVLRASRANGTAINAKGAADVVEALDKVKT